MDHNHHHPHSQSWSPLDFTRHDYPSPASPSYPLSYAQQQPFHDPSSTASDNAQFTQIQSSIGPDRVMTRSQRARQQNVTDRRFAGLSSQSSQDSGQATSGMYYNIMLPAPSRPQTPRAGPTSFQPSETAVPAGSSTGSVSFSEREHLSLSIGTATSLPTPMRSPQFPLTPASTSSSSSSGFGTRTTSQVFPSRHSRSSSSSVSTNPRSASPALSVASALTSVSSSTSAPPSSASGLRPGASLQDASSLGSPIAALTNSGLPQTFPSLPPPRPKQRKQRLFNVDRKAICQYHKDNPNARQEDIAARYGVERSTISKILKHKTKWLNVGEGDGLRVAKHRPSKFPLIELGLVEWLAEATQANQSLSDAMIRSKAREIARELDVGEDKFKASSGWVENFKHRNNIKGGKWLNFTKTFMGSGYQLRQPTPDSEDERPGVEVDLPRRSARSGDRATAASSSLHHSTGPSLSLQPAWPTVEPPNSSQSTSSDLDGAYHHHMDQHQQDQHHDQHSQDDIHMHPPAIDPSLQHIPTPSEHDPPAVAMPVLINGAPGIYIQTHSGQETFHSEGPRIPRAPLQPTLADAEEAMTTVITYLDTMGKGLIKAADRQTLYNVKCALFAAGGRPEFDRS